MFKFQSLEGPADKKRRREHESRGAVTKTETASKESGVDGALEEITRRLDALEVVVGQHDDQLRSLDAATAATWSLPKDAEIAKQLMAQMTAWNKAKPGKGPHAWGAPRRGLTKILVELLVTELADEKHPFTKEHVAMQEPQELETNSLALCLVKITKDDRTLAVDGATCGMGISDSYTR
eukprot:TRINITY_DN26911_c0_g1_i1.p2 TRINITY_DN26911_c0_g1~~TRINITY_DN26911_c0_g1_i1.p2  ORF type:complete len:180 (+),score=51.47 TRINITY_DN26911_c0_g1_i1:140-679(+)